MSQKLPRIANLKIIGPASIRVRWKDRRESAVDLIGWISTGAPILDPLLDADTFATARIGEYGSDVRWGEEDGDLAIDAAHLDLLAREQEPFGKQEAATWQEAMGLSNHEVADFLGIAVSTWNAYKAGSSIAPPAIAMVCRAADRDPVLLQAHLRPRRPAGRPRQGNPV